MSDDFDLGDLGDDAGGDDTGWLDDLVDAWDDRAEAFAADGPADATAPGDQALGDRDDFGAADVGYDGADADGADEDTTLGEPTASEIAFDLDDLDDGGDAAQAPDDGVDAGDVVIDTAGELQPGDLPGDVLRDALADIGAEDAAAVIDAVIDVGTDGGVEPRTAVSALDAAGIPARVEHADIGTLVETVANGGDVLLVGAGTPHAVVAVDVAGGVVELEAGGARSTVSLQHLADAWADLDHEVVLVPAAGDGPVRLAGESMVLAIDPTELPDRAV